jgi:hypothetical protein
MSAREDRDANEKVMVAQKREIARPSRPHSAAKLEISQESGKKQSGSDRLIVAAQTPYGDIFQVSEKNFQGRFEKFSTAPTDFGSAVKTDFPSNVKL